MSRKVKAQGFRNRAPLEKVIDAPNFSVDSFLATIINLSVEELAARYVEINSQSQMMKGLILLQARERLPSNIEFGNWIKSVSALCADGHQTLNRYMNFASYFQHKSRAGISLTACYEISRPDNFGIADKIYDKAVNQNLSIAKVKQLILEEKLSLPSSDGMASKTESTSNLEKEQINKIESVLKLVHKFHITKEDEIQLLEDCIKEIKKN